MRSILPLRKSGFDPRPWAYSAAALAIAAALVLTICSWRETPEQGRDITILLYNGAVASWNVRQASAQASAAIAPLADPKTGLAPSLAALLKAFGRLSTTVDTFNTQTGDVGRALVPAIDSARALLDTANGQMDQVGGALVPAVNRAGMLFDKYSAIPAQLGAEFGPAWLAIEPEFTCRKDGAGYGGCWHSDITGVLGEAKRAGGVFTQQFPVLVNTFQQTNTHLADFTGSFAHITGQVDTRYFSPRTRKQKVWSVTEDLLGLGALAARAR